MIERSISITPENIRCVVDTGFALIGIAMCFSIKQRAAIRRRDEQTCQMDCSKARFCNPQSPLEIHHVIPQAYARQFGIDADFPENGVSLCRDFHQKEIHNMTVLEAQRALCDRKVYWNDAHDRSLRAIAVRNTQRAIKKGWTFPSRGE